METKVLFLDSARAANDITLAQSETPTAANGWVLGASITSVADGATVGPYGYDVGTVITNGAGVPGRDVSLTAPYVLPPEGVVVSLFVRHLTLTTLRISVTDNTTFAAQSIDATWNTNKFQTGTKLNGANGAVHDFTFNQGWQRVTLVTIPGLTGSTLVSGNAFSIQLVAQNLSSTIEVWGVTLDQNPTTVRDGDGVTREFTASFGLDDGDDFVALVGGAQVPAVRLGTSTKSSLKVRLETAPASGTSNVRLVKIPAAATPYLSGINPNGFDHQSLPVFHPTQGEVRSDGDPIVVQYKLTVSGSTGSVQDRLNPAFPWVDRAALDDSDTGADTGVARKEISGSAAPSVRVIPTAFADGAVFSAAVMG